MGTRRELSLAGQSARVDDHGVDAEHRGDAGSGGVPVQTAMDIFAAKLSENLHRKRSTTVAEGFKLSLALPRPRERGMARGEY